MFTNSEPKVQGVIFNNGKHLKSSENKYQNWILFLYQFTVETRLYRLTIYSADDQRWKNRIYSRDYNRTWKIDVVSLKQMEINVPL